MNTQATVEPTEYTVTLPVVAETWLQVELFIDHLPQDLTGNTVIVNASKVENISPSFTDELCKQIIGVRKASGIVIISASQALKDYIHVVSKTRQYKDLISYRDEN